MLQQTRIGERVIERKRKDRRQAFFLKLSDAIRPLGNPLEVQGVATRMLGEHLNVTRALYGDVESRPDGVYFIIQQDYHGTDTSSLSGTFRATDFGETLYREMRSGRTTVVTDIVADPRLTDRERTFYPATGVRSFIAVPLIKERRYVAFIVVHQSAPRVWTPEEVSIVEETAERTWAVVERARAEAALRASEEKYRTLFNSIDEAFAIIQLLFDESGKPVDYLIMETNAAFERQTGLWATGKRARALIPNLEQSWLDTYGRVAKTKEPARFENYIEAMGKWFNVYATPVGHPDLNQVAIIFDNITARKKAESKMEETIQQRTAQLSETVSELEAFSYSIAHDMRAPLRSLQGFGHILAHEYSDKLDNRGQDFIRRITTSAERMDRLIQDVLNYSKILRADLPLEPVDIETILRGIIESYPQLAGDEATVELAKNLPVVIGNNASLVQCFSNLLGNAVKFVAPGVKPHIRIWAEKRGEFVRIFVKDNGIGIELDQHKNIFGMFERVSSKYEGTGIGLAIVKKATERMGGNVGVESKPGTGSTFWIDLTEAT